MDSAEAVDSVLAAAREAAKKLGFEPSQDQMRDLTEAVEDFFGV